MQVKWPLAHIVYFVIYTNVILIGLLYFSYMLRCYYFDATSLGCDASFVVALVFTIAIG